MAITAGTVASSAALIGFGLDSVDRGGLGRSGGLAVLRPRIPKRASGPRCGSSPCRSSLWPLTSRSRRCARWWAAARPSTPPSGLVLAALSLVVMPVLSYAQRRAGRELGSASAVADSKQTLLCTYLSAVLLVGLGLNSLFGWSWADPIAALVIAAVAVREGREAWRGDSCCAPGSTCPESRPDMDR